MQRLSNCNAIALFERVFNKKSRIQPLHAYTTVYERQDKPKICTFYAENCIKLAISREKNSQKAKIHPFMRKSCINMHICIYFEYGNEKETTDTAA